MQQPVANVLFLEDDALINLRTTEMIERLGYSVRPCLTVVEALSAYHENEPDLAVLDIDIRGTSSFVLADWLRHRGVPIIFLTGYDSVAPSSLRDVPICRKPCSEDQLRAFMADALKRSE
jgi:DNA-binding response OmpR family regulator